MEPLLLSTAYFGPVHYYARYLHHGEVYLEQYENFTKQTYRNRCIILGGNGPVPLVVPVVKGRGSKTIIKDLEISYDTEWQRNQWQTIVSAYNSSPYFEYYQDDLFSFFQNKSRFLLDHNMRIHELLCDFMEVENKLKLTEDFESVPENTLNLRQTISPKAKENSDFAFQPKTYIQVFGEKFDFVPNLSILDLLFNEGPNTFDVLMESVNL
ncbi:WbqC family protein [Maribellus sp. YY47]|uniref:WbqC family protein n=1 Tax=Maribellus sp. YY47 TaxID=2929486 RepID=UPI002000FAC1|nr:WbqC family protein [Maribellus sp. YY47]MCK3685425.1 WbqC family protein [Maribellus sp. YY47]